MILMHDAPLISPENKDSGAEIFAGLPKVTLLAPLPTDASTPEELRAATHAVVQALASDHVVYAELRLCPSAFSFGAAEALAAAREGLDVPGIDARLLVEGDANSWDVGEGVAGAALTKLSAAEKLRADFIPWERDVASYEDAVVAVQAGATRLVHATDLVDDFSADLDGVRPGKASAWVRDRRIALTFAPLEELPAEELADHPLPLLQQLGFTCTVAGEKLSDVFLALSETFGYGLEEFFDLTIKAIENSFASEEDRQRLIEQEILPAYEELADPEFAEDASDVNASEAEEDSESSE
ncbi:adenosine deaminase [Corynebacterium aurimucosum]|uniref:Adenosine deaminase n=2 Tax=Corynebacteriaceae TaxID=1653 RepID=A0A558GI69_9CORY|nr:adenosine deaminase [Corynebacterium sp. HMSC062A03]OFP20821.1 adenosine deaminase [Corynebacterium sp. HMSC066C02]OFT65808.1 adenosine deaminase [Corynebacterium sp. HMSC05D03]TVU56545.1 adenosine deaminase [Corynebacterium aurimucosum]